MVGKPYAPTFEMLPTQAHKAAIIRTTYSATLKVTLDCGFSLTAYVTYQSVENLSLKEESNIFASFKATTVHIIKQER